jgi:phosphoribosylaminoimidazole carboxylase (NCAIR synthetase)
MSLPGVIDTFKTAASYSITRTLAGSAVNGRYTAGAADALDIVASVQPVTGDDLKTLPEAQHTDSVIVIYTETELYTRTATHEPDVITFEAETYELFKVEKWSHTGQIFYRAYAGRLA